jgi:hypothetical protein
LAANRRKRLSKGKKKVRADQLEKFNAKDVAREDVFQQQLLMEDGR